MFLQKKISTYFFTLSLCSLPLYAHAAISIINNTGQNSTAVINGTCSSMSILGESGITKAHSSNTISDTVLWWACHSTPSNCIADVYMSTDCGLSGAKKVATILYDEDAGIKSINMYSKEYQFTVSNGGSTVLLNGGLAHLTESNYTMW